MRVFACIWFTMVICVSLVGAIVVPQYIWPWGLAFSAAFVCTITLCIDEIKNIP